MLFPVILAGGSGTRLWPLSRQFYPKQLMAMTGPDTMLQATVKRLAGVPDMAGPIVLCNERHRFLAAEQLRGAGLPADRIVLEPAGRNTAPAVTVAAIMALEKEQEATLLVMPADHHIADVQAFREALAAGRFFSDRGWLITFGVVPAAPETGYGYIRRGGPPDIPGGVPAAFAGAGRIESFVEKPDKKRAESYLRSGHYFWNSGLFMFRAGRIMEELERFVPAIVASCREVVARGRVDFDFFRLDEAVFAACPSDSIDYAVMEKTDKGVMVPLDAGWSDLGSWEALWEAGEKDRDRNVIVGDVLTRDVSGSYLRATSRLLAAVGVDNHIVVETADAVLVSPRGRAQEVKAIVDQLKRAGRPEALNHKIGCLPSGARESLPPERRRTRQIHVGGVAVGGGAPVSVQSMTNTFTSDVEATVAQIARLEEAGCEIVRVAVPDMAAAKAIAAIKQAIHIPLIADIHFNWRLAVAALDAGADGLRINPGNIGGKEKTLKIISRAKDKGAPIRIGVNSGSVEKELVKKHGTVTAAAMAESVFRNIAIFEEAGFDNIKISVKASDVYRTVESCRLVAEQCDYPLHVGVTEAGGLFSGLAKSSVGIGLLLSLGIGDTIRVSLTRDPVEEVRAGFEILRALDIRRVGPELISCPTCGRCRIDLFPIAEAVEQGLMKMRAPFKVAVMGCAVNGPGEAKEADIGIAGGEGAGVLFKKGQIVATVPEDKLVAALLLEAERLEQQWLNSNGEKE